MLGWLFDRRGGAAISEDHVWVSDAARLQGLRREIARVTGAGSKIMVVALTRDSYRLLLSELSEHSPLRCETLMERDQALSRLGKSAAVVVAHAGALPGALRSPGELQLEILVYGRSDRRAADDVVIRFADLLARRTPVTFHLSLDDSLLRRESENIKPLLARLKVPEDEPIVHRFISSAIERAQRK